MEFATVLASRARGESRRFGTVWVRTGPGGRGLRYKVRQEVMVQLLKVNQPNISLSASVPVNGLQPFHTKINESSTEIHSIRPTLCFTAYAT